MTSPIFGSGSVTLRSSSIATVSPQTMQNHHSSVFLAERPLSERESQVLSLIVEGKTNAEIAQSLHISQNTVKTHVTGILNKLGVGDRLQAAVFALRHHIL